ncbi:MAG: hypothetical protein ABIJ18_01475 [archaeon]
MTNPTKPSKERVTKQGELAEAQILGFNYCYHGHSIRELVSSMGLTRVEWETIKKLMPVSSYLPQELGDEIEDYLNEENL